MARILKFREFAKALSNATVDFDPQATQDYIPAVGSQSTPNAAGDQTQLDVPSPKSDLVGHCDSMKDMHGKLRNIFAGVRAKMDAFRSPQMRQSFERELLQGVDSVGRAHAILLPSARGI